MLKMDLEYVEGILFVRLNGTLNNKTGSKISNYLTPILKKHKIKFLVYNLEHIKSIDETGTDAILSTKCTIKRNKGKIYFCKVNINHFAILKRLHIRMISSEKTALKLIEV